MDELIDNEKVAEVGTKVIRMCFEENLSTVEIAVLFEGLSEAAVKALALKALLGEDFDKVVEAVFKMEADKAVEEAEEVLKDE